MLVILGHPREPSLCSALADSYSEGAIKAGMEVQRLNLGVMDFDPDVHEVSPADQPLEPDLEHARKLIDWADHLALIYPGWWGVGPARLKGFLDRVLLPGFAFTERSDGSFEGLLSGRTAHLITTLDMPPWVYRLIYRAPGHNAMKRSSLGFCGVDTTRILTLGPVKDSSAAEREQWIESVHDLGISLQRSVRSRTGDFLHKSASWIKALRLQFYPMTWIAYTVGALGAAAATGIWDFRIYITGFAFLFFLEAATVFTNELFDYESDLNNRHYGPFNGGSRVLVNQTLSPLELMIGTGVMMIFTILSTLFLLSMTGLSVPMLALVATMTVLALGYTIPPLKLSWRGLGELDVGFTHSLGAILCGYLFLGGNWLDPFPWLVSIPLMLAVLPSITLSGIPDMPADRHAGKNTLVVILGRKKSKQAVITLTAAAIMAVVILQNSPVLLGALDNLLPFVLAHGLVLIYLLYNDQKKVQKDGRIDSLIAISLGFIIWFGLIPLVNLL